MFGLTEAVKELARAVREVGGNEKQTQVILQRMTEMENRIMATQAELAADLKAVLAQQVKTQGEIATVQASVNTLKDKVVELEAIIAGGGMVTQELVDAVAAVKAQAQIIDDQIPDVANV